jgi:protein-tyrosine-phosphatase
MPEVRRILFVCTGNTCRSPLAEAIASRIAIERGLVDVIVESAGVSAWEGTPASDGSLLVALERNMDLGGHRARQLDDSMVRDSDLILVMGPQHLDLVRSLGGEDKAHVLSAFASGRDSGVAIKDPFGGDLDAYRATADEMLPLITSVFDRIEAEQSRGEVE